MRKGNLVPQYSRARNDLEWQEPSLADSQNNSPLTAMDKQCQTACRSDYGVLNLHQNNQGLIERQRRERSRVLFRLRFASALRIGG